MVRFGVIGYGYWGPNLVRNIVEQPGASVVAVSDLRPQRLSLVQSRYPSIAVTTDYQELLRNPAIDAVAVSTPVSTHFDLSMQALRAGKHVLVEKPMTSSTTEALTLIEEAEKRKLVLMVDHTFVYTAAVRKIHELVHSGSLGELYYYDSVRVNLGLFQPDINVIWDLAVHDLAIMDYVLGATPCAVSATGMSHVEGGPENIAYLTMFFEQRLLAHIHVNWLSPVKVRTSMFSGSRKMVVYDDMESSEKIKVYDRGISINSQPEAERYNLLVGYRSGDMWAPHLETTEALAVELQHLVRCIENGETPITGGMAGLGVVRVLEAATQSMHQRGRLVELEMERRAIV